MPGMSAAVLKVLVQAQGIAQVNSQLAGVQGNLQKTGAASGGMGAAMKKGLMVGAAAAGALVAGLFKLGEAFDDAYDTIRVGTGKTGKQLDGLKNDFKSVVKGVPASFGDASKAVAALNTRLGLTGKPLQDRAKQFLELSRITKTDVSTNIRTVTRAFGDWEVKTKDQAGTLDKFFRAAQSSGASVEELAGQVVKFGAPLRQVGFSLDEATAMFAAFEKAGVNTQTMMPGLKMALKSFMTEGIDPKKGLAQTFKGIKDGTIDAAEAMKIFGTRAGPDMVEAIRQGRFELGAMTKTLQNGKDTIRGAGKDTMDFAEHWLMFKNKVLVALEPVAIRVFDGMGKLMVVLPPIAAKVVAAIGALLAPFIAVGKAIAGSKTATLALAAATGVLLSAWAGFAIVGAIRVAIGGLVTAFWALNAAMAANPIGLVVVALAALVAAFVVAYRESETFRAIIDGAFKAVKAIVTTVMNVVVTTVKTAWALVVALTTTHWAAVRTVIAAAWSAIRAVVTTSVNAVRSVVTGAWDLIRSATSAAWNAVRDTILTAVRAARDLIGDVLAGIANRLSSAWASIRSAAGTAWAAVRDAILTPIRAARDTVQTIIGGLRDWLAERWDTIVKQAGTMKDRFASVFDRMADAIRPVKNFIGDVIDGVKEAIEWLGKIKVPKINLPDLNPFGGAGNGTTVGPPPMGLPASVDGFNPLAASFGNVVTSGYRPGDDGWHGRNRARDYAGGNMMGFARAMLSFAPKLLELIFTPLGVGVKNGQVVPISFFGADVMADHYDHVHVAMQTGGVVKQAGWALVGERGPELAHFPGGSTVYDAGQTRSALAGGGDIKVHVIFDGVPVELQKLVRVEVEQEGRRAHAEFIAGVA